MTNEAIHRMIHGDNEAFCEFYESYAPHLYHRILQKQKDPTVAKRILKEVFSESCLRLQQAGDDADTVLLLLEAICDGKLPQTVPSAVREDEESEYAQSAKTPEDILQADGKAEDTAPTPSVDEPTRPFDNNRLQKPDIPDSSYEFGDEMSDSEVKDKPRKKRAAWQILLILLLVLILLGLTWHIIGLLSSMGYIPRIDLGYTWFNEHLFHLYHF